MINVKVIERRMPHGWETLLVVNGAVGRAEEMLSLEEPIREWQDFLIPPPLPEEVIRFIDAIHQTARSVSFAGS